MACCLPESRRNVPIRQRLAVQSLAVEPPQVSFLVGLKFRLVARNDYIVLRIALRGFGLMHCQ